LEVAGRHAAQIENRQQRVEAPRPARPLRQDRRGEGDALACKPIPILVAPIADLRPPDRHRADAGLDRPLRTMAMPDEAGTTVSEPLLLHRGQECLGFRLNGFGKQPAGALAQHRGERILDSLGLSQRGNGGISIHRRIAPSGVIRPH
jgi:hypothetical protein